MVKVHKRASKRVGTKQRSKIQRKVREHHRKSKREAKKDKTWKSKKRQDPGIPNSYPYKEQLLNEIEERRRLAEEQRIQAREARQTGEEEDEVEDNILGEDGEDEEHVEVEGQNGSATTSTSAAPLLFRGNLDDFSAALGKDADPRIRAVVLLLDARDPQSWRIPALEETIRTQSKGSVELVVAMTRADLVPLETLAAWMAIVAKMYSSTVYALCSPAPAAHGIPAREGAGIAALVTRIEDILAKDAAVDGEAQAIAIIGLENSGRTSLANILAPSLPKAKVFDTPFVVQASSRLANNPASYQESDDEDEDEDEEEGIQQRDEEAAHRILIRNSGHVYKIREPLPLMHALMRRIAHPADLMMAYNTPAFGSFVPKDDGDNERPRWKVQKEKLEKDTEEFLIAVANKNGRMMKGKMPDPFAAARIVLRDWSVGALGYYAKPDEADKTEVEAARRQILSDGGLKRLVLPRKEWRKKYESKEMRLNGAIGDHGLLGKQRIAFARVTGVAVPETVEADDGDRDEDEEEEEEEEEEEDDEEEEEEEEEEEDEEDEEGDDAEEEAEEEEEVEEEEQGLAAPPPKSILKATHGRGRGSQAAAVATAAAESASRKAKRKMVKGASSTATSSRVSAAKRVRF